MPTATMWKLIQRYVTDRCSDKERDAVERWMAKEPDNRRLVENVQQIWAWAPEEDFEVNVQEAWEQFRAREMGKNLSDEKKQSSPPYKGRIVTLFRAAAAILLIGFVGFFSWQYIHKEENAVTSPQSIAMQKIVTEKGEKSQIVFSDGTVVTLNAASSLRFPKVFKGPKRVVRLNGEAYFEVAPNKEKPFVVYTQNAKIKVLGTKFNVQAWKQEKTTEVGVREGKVAVNALGHAQKDDGALLTKGQYVSVIKGGGVSGVQNVDISKYILWLQGGLYFDNESFSEVVRQLERKFNIQVTVANNQLLDVPFTGTFKDAQLEEVLDVIAASMGIQYSKKNDSIIFKGY